MKSIRSFILSFYLPLLAGIFLLLIVLLSPKFVATGSAVTVDAEVLLLGVRVPLPLWLEKAWLLRVAIVGAAVISLTKALTLDFSRYFPSHLHMDVYFDAKGIERNLSFFSADELNQVSLAADWKDHINRYDEAFKASLEDLWRQRNVPSPPNISDFSRFWVEARGSTSFVVRRIGLLSYRIQESSGRLDYVWAMPKQPRRSFSTAFELHETPSNHLRPSVGRLLRTPTFILKPQFKQILSAEGAGLGAPFDHLVIGLTKVCLLPYPHLTNTIYLWMLQEGKTVPVAYAVYIPDTPG